MVLLRGQTGKVINNRFQIRERRRAIGPDVGFVSLFLAWSQHVDWRFISVQNVVF